MHAYRLCTFIYLEFRPLDGFHLVSRVFNHVMPYTYIVYSYAKVVDIYMRLVVENKRFRPQRWFYFI